MKPLGKVKIEWSPEFAYAIGLIATDGCLYNDGRHINLTSKDDEQIKNFLQCLNLNSHIGKKFNGAHTAETFVVQFGDVNFYNFLCSIGITPHKSKTIGEVKIPTEYFFDFLRGAFDGDGTFYSYWDPRWRSSFMFYLVFASASEKHILWLREKIFAQLGINGHLTKTGATPMYAIKYAKTESLKLLSHLYYNRNVVCLSRKRIKIEKTLAVISEILTD
jgi:hypothetical protein